MGDRKVGWGRSEVQAEDRRVEWQSDDAWFLPCLMESILAMPYGVKVRDLVG